MATNKGAPASRGAKAFKNWVTGRFEAIHQKYRGEWFSAARLVADGVINNIALAGEFLAWMRVSRQGGYEQKGTNGSASYRIYTKEELRQNEERAHQAFLNSQQTEPVLVVPAPPTAPVTVEQPQDSNIQIGPSPETGMEYTKLAADPTVISQVQSRIPPDGSIRFVDLHKAMKEVPGWNKSSDKGFGRMLAKMSRLGHIQVWVEGHEKFFAHPKSKDELTSPQKQVVKSAVRKTKLPPSDHIRRIAELEAEVARLQDRQRADQNARTERAITELVAVLKPLDHQQQDRAIDELCRRLNIVGLREYEDS